jgi:uncharacterized RDD family membrane protein YckC
MNGYYPNAAQMASVSGYRYGGFGRRFVATVIDLFLVSAVLALAGGVLLAATDSRILIDAAANSRVNGTAEAIVASIVSMLYFIGTTAVGGSVGKRILGMRITNAVGQAPGLTVAVLRGWWMVLTLLLALVLAIAGRTYNADPEAGPVAGSIKLINFSVVAVEGIWVIGCLFVLGSVHKQALHDKFAGTYVIRASS